MCADRAAVLPGEDAHPRPGIRTLVSARAARSGPSSCPRLRVVRVLARRGPQQPIAVAAELAMSQASLTGLVDGLVTDGLVVRVRHPTDGRAQLLTLTDAGTAAAGAATSVTAAAELFAGMPRQDVLAALEVVKELSARLRAATRAQKRPLMP